MRNEKYFLKNRKIRLDICQIITGSFLGSGAEAWHNEKFIFMMSNLMLFHFE